MRAFLKWLREFFSGWFKAPPKPEPPDPTQSPIPDDGWVRCGGAEIDKCPEVCGQTFGGPFELRCLSARACGDYFLNALVTENRGLAASVAGDGVTLVAREFVSARSGLLYVPKSFTTLSDSRPEVPLVNRENGLWWSPPIPPGEYGTCRVRWSAWRKRGV